jgi:putative transposase
MPRPPRLQLAGGIYHVTSRGNRKQPTFREGRDCEQFLVTLEAVVVRRKWLCHTYCLMPNHVHLVVETPNPDLSAGMQYLNGSYAQWFNRRHGFEGHLFQGRFHAVLVKSEWHLLELSRYVVLNPVRAKLVPDAGSWKWSSYRACVGEAPVPAFLTTEFVLGHFGRTLEEARGAYRRFVRDAPEKARGP